VHRVELQEFELGVFQTKCFVVKDGGEALVIDPGEARQDLLEALAGIPKVTVVNTHCHIDHCGGNAGVMEATGAPLLMHRDSLPLLHAMPQQAMMFGVFAPPSPEPTGFLDEGDTVTVGAVSLAVRFTPGHAPGHIVLVGDGFVFGGDVLFQDSIGRTDLPGGDYQTLMASIRDKMLTLPDETIVYNGHTPATTIGRERRLNPFLQGL
jgi:glyoxylase-like metal-dependent hydrolase (beta-lactamase superfamily II)